MNWVRCLYLLEWADNGMHLRSVESILFFKSSKISYTNRKSDWIKTDLQQSNVRLHPLHLLLNAFDQTVQNTKDFIIKMRLEIVAFFCSLRQIITSDAGTDGCKSILAHESSARASRFYFLTYDARCPPTLFFVGDAEQIAQIWIASLSIIHLPK